MKKVININFSGRLISIEEDAYLQLQTYIESLKKHFSNEKGQEEIIADIENRIAEIFSEKQRKGTTSITYAEVDEVIGLIGKPEDFDPIEDISNTSNTKNTTNTTATNFAPKAKLFRDGKDKMIGGVAGGIAAFFNIDTTLVRIIFAVLFFGAGFGFLLYIILWVVVPENKNLQTSSQKKLYRNPDDKMIGGVAGGLSQYFGIDTWIPRLIFAAPFLFTILRSVSAIAYHNVFNDHRFWSFSFGGTTTVIYFLLWWIIPEAKTVQEKMAMKGEKLDLNSIKNNVQDGIKSLTDNANQWSQQFSQRINDNSSRFNSNIRNTNQKIGHGIGLLVKGFLLFIGGILAFALLMALIGLMASGFSFWPFKAFILEDGWQTTFFWGSLLVLIIPSVAFITWLVRRIFKIKVNIKPIKIVLTLLFLLGIVSSIFLSGSLISSFQYSNNTKTDTPVNMNQPNGTLLISVNEPEIMYSGELPWVHIDDDGFDITKDSLKYANVKVKIVKSSDSAYHTFINKISCGKTLFDADTRAQKIVFNYSIKENNIDLGSHLTISKNEKFRNQQIEVVLEVPEGKKIEFDETIEKLHPYNIRLTEINENGRNKFRKKQKVYFNFDEQFDFEVNQPYIMTKNGLQLVNKPKLEKDKSYNENFEEKQQRIEELKQERKNDSLDKEIERLQKQKDKNNGTITLLNDPFCNAHNLIGMIYVL